MNGLWISVITVIVVALPLFIGLKVAQARQIKRAHERLAAHEALYRLTGENRGDIGTYLPEDHYRALFGDHEPDPK